MSVRRDGGSRSAARSRASASAPGSSGSRSATGVARPRAQRLRAASRSRPSATARPSSASSTACATPPPRRPRSATLAGPPDPAASPRTASSSSRAADGATAAVSIPPDLADVRRLPRRDLRPGRPALPLPVHQLHQLRAALHDRRATSRTTARPRRWRASRCARAAAPSTRTRPTAASTRSRTPARPAARALGGSPRRASAVAGDAIRSAAPPALSRAGLIVAVKGLGGFHLACDADLAGGRRRGCARASTATTKPFAVMVRDLAAAADRWPCLGADERRAARSRPSGRSCCVAAPPATPALAPRVAPDTRLVGLMLPYTPLHHLLLARRRAARS